MKFNIDNYKGKYVMHCKTEEEAKDFCEYLHRVGRTWCTKQSYLEDTEYRHYTKHTAYSFNEGCYTEIDWYRNHGYTILEWSDYMNKEFTKADLKTGDVILRRNGMVEILNRETGTLICKSGGWNGLAHVNNDLTDGFIGRECDIVEVRRPKEPCDCCFDAMNTLRRGTLVYERKEVEEMTLAEVCRLLGKEVKIVK